MSTKHIEKILAPRSPHMVGDGFRVHNFIPSVYPLTMERMSPFIMLDYGSKHYFAPTETPRGVGVHPHRGFETVTIAYKGKVAHHDSAGNNGIIGEGDVQWMTAGAGILHKEYHEENFSKTGGIFQMVQLWVNLPSKHKMTPPKYQEVTNQSMAKYNLPDDGGVVEVIAGNYHDLKGSASTFTPVNLLNTKLNKGASVTFDFPAHYNTAVLVIEGSVSINHSETITENHFVLMKNEGENFSVEAIEDSIVLVLSGEPINEPIFSHGPFVMNTREEIMQAITDLSLGKFGTLKD